jgi:hypothetical protein
MDPREELMALRRMAELEAKASGQVSNGVPVGRQGVTGIPTEPGANLTPTAAPERSMFERAMGNIETIPAMVGGAVGGVVAPIAQLGHEMLGGQAFTPQGKAAAAQFGQQVQQQFYQPRTPEAQRNVQAIGEMVPPFAGLRMGGPTGAFAPATRAIGDVARSESQLVGGAVNQALAARAGRIQEARAAQSYANAPTIDAAQAAQRLGGAVPPAVSNPTVSNVIKGKLIGPEMQETFAKKNEVAVTNKVREDLGIAPTERLNAARIEKALDDAGKANDPIRAIPILTPNANIISQLEALKKPVSAVAKGRVETSNVLINNLIEEIKQGRSGADVLNDIRTLRREAIDVYKRKDKGVNPPTAPELAEADARKGAADIYEKLIDSNVRDPNVIANLQAARTKMAQIYQHSRALDYAKEKVDPQSYVKMFEESQGKITGVASDIAKAASIFPDYFTLTPAEVKGMPRLSRAGLGAATGGAIGALGGPVTATAGLIAGTAAGSLASGLAAKRMATPAYQAAYAMPKDYRPPVNMLRPVEPNVVTNGLVPYNYAQSVVMPGEQPNFIFGRPEAQVTAGMPQGGPAQLAAPSGEATMAAIAAERARAAAMSRTLGQQAEQQQVAQAAAERKPTGAGSMLEFDPITGTYKVGGAGVKGATPEIFQADTGASLKSATDKVAAGKLFDLDAAEKVAWEKTKVDLAAVDPGLTKLSDKAVAAKMMDRQWIADTIKNLQEKDRVFNEIAQKSALNRAASDVANQAALKREQMLQQLMELQDNLRPARPVQKGGQGSKTRAFQRNMLTPEQEIQNALAEPTYRVEIRGTSTSGKK